MSDNAHYTIPKPPGRWRAITLALVMHVALFLFFWIGMWACIVGALARVGMEGREDDRDDI